MNGSDDLERASIGSVDTNVMTIEFLRARLQTERSISKSSSRRADDLAKRVVELEENLRIAISQKQKAEEATANLLKILKHNTLNKDFAAPGSSKKESSKELNEKSESSNFCSQTESRCQIEGSLTWNSTKSTSKPVERSIPRHRRWNSVSSLPPSTPQRSGKSCRQIRPSSRCVNDSEIVSQAESKEPEDTEADKIPRKKNDEKALEAAIIQRQQLIGQYEAMERAQKEWEENFKDSFDKGNLSDISEKANESRRNSTEEFSFPADISNNPNPQIGETTELPLTLFERKESDDVEGILEALKQAKLCLKNKIVTSSPSPIKSLFRLPTGSPSQERSQSLIDEPSNQRSFGRTLLVRNNLSQKL